MMNNSHLHDVVRDYVREVLTHDTIDSRLIKDLSNHIEMNKRLRGASLVQLRRMLRNMSAPALIHPPSSTVVFRGSLMHRDSLSELLEKTIDVDAGKSTIDTDVGSSAMAESWTTDLSVARGFAYKDWPDESLLCIVWSARTADNVGSLVSCEDGLYTLPELEEHHGESEVIAIDPIRVFSVEWAPRF